VFDGAKAAARRGVRAAAQPAGFSIAASLVTLASLILVLWLVRPSIAPEPVAEEPVRVDVPAEVVAELSRQIGSRWGSDGRAPPARTLLAGQTVHLKSGLAEFDFHGQVTIVLRGPATLVAASAHTIELVRGELSADVSPEARGFVVDMPAARVVDLGTEFSVHVGDSGACDVCVFRGSVDVDARGTPDAEPRHLTAGMSVHVDLTGTIDSSYSPPAGQFLRLDAIRPPVIATHACDLLSAPPKSVAGDSPATDPQVAVFLERNGVTLIRDVDVTFTLPGEYVQFAKGPLKIARGIRVDSYLVHYLPGDTAGKTIPERIGVLTFDRPIVGVIALDTQLNDSDALLGTPATDYGPKKGRGLEHDSNYHDTVWISPDRKTLKVEVRGGGLRDQVRVLVEASREESQIGNPVRRS
jgi:hypothetical protein